MNKEQETKNRVYDETLCKINWVLGGKLDPEVFAEMQAAKICDLECQVSSLRDIMAIQENRIKELEHVLEVTIVTDQCLADLISKHVKHTSE